MKHRVFLCCYLLIVAVFFYNANKSYSEISINAVYSGLKSLQGPKSIKLFGVYDFPDNSIYIWGWMPIYGLNSNQLPATKMATFEQEIFEDRPFVKQYRDNLINSLRTKETGIIIDANTVGGIGYEGLFKNIIYFPDLADLIDVNYFTYNSLATKNCPLVYFNVKYKKLLEDRFLIPKSVNVSSFWDQWGGDKLIDKNITGQCNDSWLLPDGVLGNAIITFERSNIKQIAVLNSNTRPYAPPSGTKKISIHLHDNIYNIFNKSVELKPYPYWTIITLPNDIFADTLTIEVDSYFGKGAGISEILFFK